MQKPDDASAFRVAQFTNNAAQLRGCPSSAPPQPAPPLASKLPRFGARSRFHRLPRCICGVVCHSQVLAKYARPFVSDLLFWPGRHSAFAANGIKCFCFPRHAVSGASAASLSFRPSTAAVEKLSCEVAESPGCTRFSLRRLKRPARKGFR